MKQKQKNKISSRIQTNQKNAKTNFVNTQKLEDTLDGKDVDNSDACKQHPEAC